MILGIDDITGGHVIVAIIIWLGLTGLFYLTCYLAVTNVLDDLTKNSLAKIPIMASAAVPASFLVAIFNYKPLILFILMLGANFFRVKSMKAKPEKFKGADIHRPLHYFSSYLYIVLFCSLAYYLQIPVEVDGASIPYWKTLFPAE